MKVLLLRLSTLFLLSRFFQFLFFTELTFADIGQDPSERLRMASWANIGVMVASQTLTLIKRRR